MKTDNQNNKRTGKHALIGLWIVSALFALAGCSNKEETTTVEIIDDVEKTVIVEVNEDLAKTTTVKIADDTLLTAEKNVEAIRSVLEKQFNGPDETYLKLKEELNPLLMASVDDEGQDALLVAPEHKAINEHIAETFAKFFTEFEYGEFALKTAFVHHPTKEGEKVAITDLVIEQSTVEESLYYFTVQVDHYLADGKITPYEIKGEAILPIKGKIGKLSFTQDELAKQLVDESIPKLKE